MKQVALDEVLDGKAHGVVFNAAALLIAAIFENDAVIFDGQNPFVGNRAAPDVARQIRKNAIAVGIAFTEFDVPLDPPQLVLEIEPLLVGHAGRQLNSPGLDGVVQIR